MDARIIDEDWLGYECKSGQILFYYNKKTGEHKWPCCSRCPEKGLHSVESSSSHVPAHPSTAASVNVGTQTDDTGCVNGCTSIFVNKNIRTKERLDLRSSQIEGNLENNIVTHELCFVHEEVPRAMDVEVCEDNEEHFVVSAKSVASDKEDGHNEELAEEESNHVKGKGDIEANILNEAIVKEKSIVLGRQELPIVKNSSSYVSSAKQPFMNLKNVSKIIIENPHHESVTDISPPRRQVLEIQVPDGSSSLEESCANTGSPSRLVPTVGSSLGESFRSTGIPRCEVGVTTGIPTKSSPNANCLFDERCTTTANPNDYPSSEISLDKTCTNTGVPRDNSPVESSLADSFVTTGIPKEAAGGTSLADKNITTMIPKVTYTHVIHVDTAITSAVADRRNLASQPSEVPSDYRMIVYPDREEVSHPECAAGTSQEDTGNGQKKSSPHQKTVQPRKTQRFRASPNRPCGCPLCDTMLPNTKTFYEHLLNHCDWNTNECAICRKSFAKKYHLQRHLQSHASYRPHECIRCGKLFLRAHHLKSHLLTHTNDATNVYMAFV